MFLAHTKNKYTLVDISDRYDIFVTDTNDMVTSKVSTEELYNYFENTSYFNAYNSDRTNFRPVSLYKLHTCEEEMKNYFDKIYLNGLMPKHCPDYSVEIGKIPQEIINTISEKEDYNIDRCTIKGIKRRYSSVYLDLKSAFVIKTIDGIGDIYSYVYSEDTRLGKYMNAYFNEFGYDKYTDFDCILRDDLIILSVEENQAFVLENDRVVKRYILDCIKPIDTTYILQCIMTKQRINPNNLKIIGG